MSNQTIFLNDAIYRYMRDTSLREGPVLKALREETARMPQRQMQIAPEQGHFMGLLVRLLQARNVLEIGVFTGYSTLAMASALSRSGKVVACDISEEWTSIARRYWQQAGIDELIDLRLAPAKQTLHDLENQGHSSTFDFAFIDADKSNYPDYYESVLTLLRSGGLVAVDNVLWGGQVADDSVNDEETATLRQFNERLLHDERVDISLVPIGDGLMLARKR